MARGVIPD